MDEEKRMAGSYKVLYNIHIGDREVLFGENHGSTDMRYMVCFCDWNNPLGIENFTDAAGSNDYLEMMTEFNDRVRSQIEAVKSERDKITVPLEPFTLELSDQIKSDTELESTVAVIKPESLRPERARGIHHKPLFGKEFQVEPRRYFRGAFLGTNA